MRLAAVETFLVRHALSRPTGPSGASNTARQTLVIKLTSRDGLLGWGETYAVAGVRAAIDDVLAPLLLSQDELELGRLHQLMDDATFGNGFAVGGVDIALHDLRGHALGVPVCDLYGGPRRRSVPAYASGLCFQDGVDPRDTWPGEAQGLVDQGFRAIKMRIGRSSPSVELPLIEQLRLSIPADIPLMVDAWGAYTPPTALRVGRALERLGIAWYEEPLPQTGYVGYAELAAALDIPIAGGETCQTRASFKELFDRKALDIVQPDICICGGLAESLFVADLARLYGIPCMPHTWNGAIMHVASLHVAAVLPEPTRVAGAETPLLEYDTTENQLISNLLQPKWLPVDGYFRVPTGPGLGVTVDEEWIRAHAVGA
jgi:D-galactarolactone cycloisomerase